MIAMVNFLTLIFKILLIYRNARSLKPECLDYTTREINRTLSRASDRLPKSLRATLKSALLRESISFT